MNKGILITMEGTDGSGKSTQINLLKNYLQSKGKDVVIIREPGGTRIGEKIRDIILDKENTEMHKITEMLLYASSRAQLIQEVIKPELSKGKCIICDRFVDSSYVYQGFARNISLEKVLQVNEIALSGVTPDITIFFDITPEVSLKRKMKYSAGDRIELEKIEFHNNVYEGYKKLISLYPNRIKSLNANRSPENIFNDVKLLIENILD